MLMLCLVDFETCDPNLVFLTWQKNLLNEEQWPLTYSKTVTETQLSGSPGWLHLLTCFPSPHQLLPQVGICTRKGNDEPLHLHPWYRGPPHHPRNVPLGASLPRKPLSPFTAGSPVSDSTCLSWNKHGCSFRPPVFHTCLPLPPHLPPQSPVIQTGQGPWLLPTGVVPPPSAVQGWIPPLLVPVLDLRKRAEISWRQGPRRWGLKPGPSFRLCRNWVSTLSKGTFDKVV